MVFRVRVTVRVRVMVMVRFRVRVRPFSSCNVQLSYGYKHCIAIQGTALD